MSAETSPWGSYTHSSAPEKGFDFGPDQGFGTGTGFDSDPGFGFGPSAFDSAPTQGFEVAQSVEKRESRFQASIREMSKKAVESVVALRPESKISVIAENIPADLTFGNASDGAWGVFDTVREDVQSTWGNRGDVLQAGGAYVANAGLEVGKQGLDAALEVIKKDTGISVEKDENGANKLKIRKGKLAKFALKAAFTGGGSVLNTGRKAGVAGMSGLRSGAVSQARDARSQAIQATKSYAFSQFGN